MCEFSKCISDLRNEILLGRSMHGTKTDTPKGLMTKQRFPEDDLPIIWNNIRINEMRDARNKIRQEKTAIEPSDEAQIHESVKANNIIDVYKAIKKSDNVNAEDKNHQTAIMLAVQQQEPRMLVDLLLLYGGSISDQNNQNQNAFTYGYEAQNTPINKYLFVE